jgi:Novel STAND NTPase 1
MPGRSSQPYVGPRPFETTDRGLFFGRNREAEDVLSLIMFHRTILLYAQSGAGKSSLINTTIIPGLHEAGFATPPAVRIRGAPATVADDSGNVYVANIRNAIAPEMPRADAGELRLVDVLGRVAPPPGGQGPVLVFDQFEELFTSYQDRWPDREDLFRQIAEALDGIPTLRVLFSMREDFIAELDPLIWQIPQGIDVRYRLELLRHDAAIAAVIEPARASGLTFTPAAAEKLVRDLRQINVEGPGGGPRQVDGEYIEPVQLQIVCKRLWDRLPEDIAAIDESHLGQFGDVSDALREFYLAAVRHASQLTGYPEKLIHLGCTQFVTSSGTRSMVHRSGANIGRLPSAVVDSLVDQHFLRAEIRAGARWYEISHDRLIAPVLERKLNDEELKILLQTRDLLEAALESWKADPQFDKHSQILTALSRVERELVLSNQELEFLCMNSIGSGFEIVAWVGRLKVQVPQLLEAILLRAGRHRDSAIRRNAAIAIAHSSLAAADAELLQLALEDDNAEVRKLAAVAMAQANRTDLIAPLVAQLGGSLRRRALAALARICDEGVAEPATADLAQLWRRIGLWNRIPLTLTIAAVRLRQLWPMILYIGLLGGLSAGLFCAVARVPAAALSLTITNHDQSFAKAAGSALFQGMAGGIVWGGCTAAYIALGWILFRRRGQRWMTNRYAVNLVFGIIGGVLGGIGVFAEIFFVFEPSALADLGWIPDIHSDTLGSCIQTGYCLFHPALGFGYGAGIGLGLAALHTTGGWQRLLLPHIEAGKIVAWRKTAGRILGFSLAYSIASVPLLFLSGLAFVVFKGFQLDPVLGETTTIYVGNIGTIAGILLGQIIMRVGIVIPPLTD